MGTEITIARKRLSDIQTARLIVDESPPDPRASGSATTTIVAWRRDHRMSDTEIYGTKQEFRENVLDRMERNGTSQRPRPLRVYEHESRGMVRDLMDASKNTPGVLRPVHMHEHGGIRLNTEGSHDDWDARHLGWVYIASRQMRKYRFSTEQAMKTIQAELEELESYANGTVYAVLLERAGQDNELTGDIYPSREHGIDDELLDETLRGMDLSPDERRCAAQAVWEWLRP